MDVQEGMESSNESRVPLQVGQSQGIMKDQLPVCTEILPYEQNALGFSPLTQFKRDRPKEPR